MGKVFADRNADLMNINSWEKSPDPALQTSDLTDQAGPGHNSFVVDENGNQLIVYHARPFSHFDKKCGSYCDEPLYDPCRHARVKLVTFDKNDVPILK
jgi:GH43 family beta-xylosidase